MLAENDPKQEIIKENIYKSFEQLLKASGYPPKEFTEDTAGLIPIKKADLVYKGIDARMTQLEYYIDQLKSDYDPEEYRSRILEILNTERRKKNISDDLHQDLINYIRYDGQKR